MQSRSRLLRDVTRHLGSFQILNIHSTPTCGYASRKRFYKNTGVLHGDGKYEVTLDQRRLKTPIGKPFSVESEPLALAVAAEWDAQETAIQQSSMHLTSLCNTVLDNPNNLTKLDMVHYLVNYLQTDTMLFQSHENDMLYELQKKEWDTVIQWFCDTFMVDIKKTRTIDAPTICPETEAEIRKYFLSNNFAAVSGYIFGVDTLKSVILMMACVEKFISVEKAVYLSRLEEEFQTNYWGRVEWSHDLNQQDLQARVSAALLFIHCNTNSQQRKQKTLSI